MSAAPKETPWSAATNATPVAAAPGRDFGARSYLRPLLGLFALLSIVGVVIAAATQFRGGFTDTVPVTVISDRAGLLMNPGARVKLNGAQIGTVAGIRQTPDGRAELQLAMQPDRLNIVPDNVLVEIGSTTVFGAKSVEFLTPERPSTNHLRGGQTLDSRHVTVEVNTIFEQLDAVLRHIDPAKLNETLGAISTAVGGRGEAFGRTLTDVNSFLGVIEPSLPQLSTEIQTLPDVATAYADAAPDLLATVRNTTRISHTLVDEQADLDRLLVSSIGLADIGNDVIGTNRAPLTNLMHLLVPTTDLTNEYHDALNCGLTGILQFALKPPGPDPGVTDMAAFSLGLERYRYPQDLPKVAASGGPLCNGQLPVAFNQFPPKVVADVGTNPNKYGNVGPLLNSDLLKQILFGPIDGPPRNTAQWGQPG
jgi:phospholipid/cholesterol/gamma-HCH transport system substrate-binding protein